MSFTVRNVRGTAGRGCACGSWLEHYYFHSKSTRTICAAFSCGNPAEVGAHVHDIKSRRGNDWAHWIVPFCHDCNMVPAHEDIDLKIGVELISANTQLMGCYRG